MDSRPLGIVGGHHACEVHLRNVKRMFRASIPQTSVLVCNDNSHCR
jgi:hypothetical protein